MAKTTKIKAGGKVTYHYWTQGKLCSAPATIVEIHPADEGAQMLSLEVDFPAEVLEREGYVRAQTHARQRTRTEEDVHTSGTWST